MILFSSEIFVVLLLWLRHLLVTLLTTIVFKARTWARWPYTWGSGGGGKKLSKGKAVSTVFHLNKKEAKRELHVYVNTNRLNFQPIITYLGVKLYRTLSYRQHIEGLRDKVIALIRKLVGTGWESSPPTLRTSTCVCTGWIIIIIK